MTHSIEINKRAIGVGFPVYIIAELSANHNQDFNQAVQLVHAAKAVGADAVKVQTFTADTLTMRSNKEYFLVKDGTPWNGRMLYDLYREASMPWDWQPKLKVIANELGLDFFSTAFDSSSVDFLEKMNVPAYKVASFELVDIPLIQKIAQTKKPLILSTGMATFDEIKEAVDAARNAGAKQIALLKCTSAYPASPKEMNLRVIPDMSKAFGVPVGLSDHTLCSVVATTAIALGACIVEKHLTLSRRTSGLDSKFSLEPAEFKELVQAIRLVETTFGAPKYAATDGEKGCLTFRRSLFVVKDMKDGDKFTYDNLRSIRPAFGLSPKYLNSVIGKKAKKNIDEGTPLTWELVA